MGEFIACDRCRETCPTIVYRMAFASGNWLKLESTDSSRARHLCPKCSIELLAWIEAGPLPPKPEELRK